MILKIYSTYDSKAHAYMAPFYMHEDGMATRVFQQAITDSTHQFGKAPQDYTLFRLGTFDDSSGTLHNSTPISLGNGLEFLKPITELSNDTELDPLQPSTSS